MYLRAQVQSDRGEGMNARPQSIAARASLLTRRAAADARRAAVRALLAEHPSRSTDDIAAILGVDRSTIRRDRKKIGMVLARASTPA